jgi:hypothetical protein
MSQELHIFMQGSRVPNRDAWQQAIEELGFPAVLASSLDLRQCAGFTPSSYKGLSTGFELSLEPAEEVLSSYSHIASRVSDRDKCATFRWGGNLTECAASLSAAAALAKLTDGVYYYPNDDLLYGADEAVAATRRDLDAL